MVRSLSALVLILTLGVLGACSKDSHDSTSGPIIVTATCSTVILPDGSTVTVQGGTSPGSTLTVGGKTFTVTNDCHTDNSTHPAGPVTP